MKILLNVFINSLKGKYKNISSQAVSYQAYFIIR